MDTNGRIPTGFQGVRRNRQSDLGHWSTVLRWSPRERNVEVVQLPTRDGRVDLRQLISFLGRRDVHNALFEGGGSILGTLFDERLVDKVAAFVAPVIIGGRNAATPVAGEGASDIGGALRLVDVRRTQLGLDILTTGYVPKKA